MNEPLMASDMPESAQERLVRCPVTGKRVRESEMVMLQGQRMSAAAKQNLLERLPRVEVGALELVVGETPPLGVRVVGALLDIAAFVAVAFVVLVFALAILMPELANATADHPPEIPEPIKLKLQVVFNITAIVFLLFFQGVIGRTPGKMWGRTRVVRVDGLPMDFQTAMIRTMALLVPIFMNLAATVVGESRTTLMGLIALVWLVYPLIDLWMTVSDKDQQRSLHDRIAGTRVVRERK